MSDRGLAASADAYPEREERRPSMVEKALLSLAYVPQSLLARAPAPSTVAGVQARAKLPADFAARVRDLRYELRRTGLGSAGLEQAVALAAAQVHAQLGIKPGPGPICAALALARGGRCVEATDVGDWPLAVAMAAVAVALAGIPVHVITVTAHLARRDAEAMRPLYAAFGLSVGVVEETTQEADRRQAYGADVAYCVHREVALDYLRDRLVLKGRPRALRLRTEALTSPNPRAQHLMLRGLQCAIVCEGETILVDAAQTPITISGHASASQEAAWLVQGLQMARALVPGAEYEIPEIGLARLTDAGRARLAQMARQLPGVWQGARRREEIVQLALVAERMLEKDRHYEVAGESLTVAEEVLRQHAGDAGNARLLRLLLESKENCALSGARETLARIGYQRFFRRYLRLSALSLGARQVSRELWGIYRLRRVVAAPGEPALGVRLPDRFYADKASGAEAVLARVRELRAHGHPVLVVTRTPQAAAAWSQLLETGGVPNQRLAGSQDAKEEEAFGQVCAPGRVTVAPYFAARGKRAEVMAASADKGGLRIIQVQPLAYGRQLQYLVERGIPRGSSGSVQRMVVMDDDLVGIYVPGWWVRWRGMPLRRAMLRYCQWAAARDHAQARSELLRVEDYLGDVFAFSGRQG
jgi:preprotein translocase subunit SecA